MSWASERGRRRWAVAGAVLLLTGGLAASAPPASATIALEGSSHFERGSELTLGASSGTIDAAGVVTLVAHLGPHLDTSNKSVTLFATPFGRESREVASGVVDASGDFSATYKPRRNTTFIASWDGDENYSVATSDPVDVLVRVSARCRLTDAYGRSGRYKLFRLAAGAPMVGEVVPKQVGRPLRFVVHKRLDGRWRFHEASSFPISSSGTVTAYFKPTRPGTFRIRTVFDVFDYVRDGSRWRYLKITHR